MRISSTYRQLITILFCIGTFLAGAAQAQPFIVDAQFSHTHQAQGLVTPGSSFDLLDWHYDGGTTTLGGEFQDALGANGACDWQGWTSHDLSGTPAVGNFAQLLKALPDIDPCHSNYTCQVVFIDDGLVVPGTGGWSDITWPYGPGGYTINPGGGLAGDGHYLWNEIWSPELIWPAGNNAARLAFDVYLHEELAQPWARIFVVWHVRSWDPALNSGAGDWTPWRDRERHYYGGPSWVRIEEIVSDLLVPGCEKVQIALGVKQEAPAFARGNRCTPAPYFDNVEFESYHISGATITMVETPPVPPSAHACFRRSRSSRPARSIITSSPTPFTELWPA